MKLKLRFDGNSTYATYAEGKVTVCTLKCSVINTQDPNNPLYSFSSIGRTTCSSNDKLDPVIGKRLAESKAKNHAWRVAKQYITGIYKEFDEYYQAIKKFDTQLNHLIDKEVEHIEELKNA